ncbi:MAG: hypothetical protein J7L64_09810 [Acidobacteria bacterium]|nr:hypothetical protein [Acidobacteriota bacterium]
MKKDEILEPDKKKIEERLKDETLEALTKKRKEAEEEFNRRLTAVDELFRRSIETGKGERVGIILADLNRWINERVSERQKPLIIRAIRAVGRKILSFFFGDPLGFETTSRIIDFLNRENEIRNEIILAERELNQAMIHLFQSIIPLIAAKEAELLRLVTHLPIKRMDLILEDIGKKEEELTSLALRLSKELESLKKGK